MATMAPHKLENHCISPKSKSLFYLKGIKDNLLESAMKNG
jgi:hypothetical protein